MVSPYQRVLELYGFALAAEPLRRLFKREGVTDPRLQCELALDVIENTIEALATLTRPKTVH